MYLVWGFSILQSVIEQYVGVFTCCIYRR